MIQKNYIARYFFVIILCLVFIGNPTWAGECMTAEPIAKLYFVVPFSIETYIPITIESIEEGAAHHVVFMNPHSFVEKLPGVLQSHPTNKTLNLKGIRLKFKLYDSESVFWVDREGVVGREGSNTNYLLTGEELASLEQELKSFIGVVDVKAYKNWMKENGD